ncbi:OmpL47-type beta-barrel domain-containing protein [Paenibacillus allorhizosphaerae]|uniref:FIMAH domain-containing protein n=1 Tax=Paenibacillus allorhizosphaerae TaxID=2849866 RepID=A0ABN7TQS4_9BACL|nr:hypothetical protein [Paenibacillus allorhizosphaerae]CAG7651892.1 hypothetical protein PAECIP111802_05085 [Paenibacillus allorhizosphaerae]
MLTLSPLRRLVASVLAIIVMFGATFPLRIAPAFAEAAPRLDNYFKVSSGKDQGKKMPLYDATIEKYNGYYYVAGTGTAGNFYRSPDLIHWEGPIRFISTDPATLPPYAPNDPTLARYGASDFFYHNGVMFYGFNSTNLLHGNPSTMSTAAPMFEHSFWNQPYDSGIDPQFFISANGDLVYLRKVNPDENDPNTGMPMRGRAGAWLWKVNSFFDELGNPSRGKAKEMMYSQPGHWGNLNHLNFEGPELAYHNGQYYMLYASNQMDPRTGLYETGVAQASTYDGFDNSKKYPGKLLARNIESLLLNYKVILPTSEHGAQTYKFTYTDPDQGWESISYPATGWNSGDGGFGWPQYIVPPAKVPSIYTVWGSPTSPDTLWARRTFTLNEVPGKAVLRHRLEGYGSIYINGQEVVKQNGAQPAYKMVEVPAGLLKPGQNVIAAKVSHQGPVELDNYHLDFGLYDTNGLAIEPDIVGPSQPNIVKGPNGFETWIMYKAFWDGVNGQGKDRVEFWGDEMVVDGPSSGKSEEMKFDAWTPSFQDRFEASTSSLANYTVPTEGVSMKDGRLAMDGTNGPKQLLLSGKELENYFMEINIRFDSGERGQAGAVVWYRDENNQVKLLIDREQRKYRMVYKLNGQESIQEAVLPSTFRFRHEDPRAAGYEEQYHTLIVYKNGSKLFAELDHYKLNNDQPVLELPSIASPGQLGYACEGAACSMDNVTVTSGWNEYGTLFEGWSDKWQKDKRGLTSPSIGEAITVKGDPTREHEFSVNIHTGSLPDTGKAGIILAYVDPQNYMMAYTNYENKQFEIVKVENGKRELLQSVSTSRDTIYGHVNPEPNGQTEYIYRLRGPAEVSQARVLWTYGEFKYLNKSFLLPNQASPNFGFDRWDAGKQSWNAIPFQYTFNGRGVYHDASFTTSVKTDQLRMRVPAQINRPFSFAIHEDISSQNFYKTVRKDGRIYVWINHKLVFNVEDPFLHEKAKTGLYTDGVSASYNAVTAFDISDTRPPHTEAEANGQKGDNGWYNSDVTITLSSSGVASGTSGTYYSLDGGASWTLYSQPIAVTTEGVTSFHYYSVDELGNQEPVRSMSIAIDKTAPTIASIPDRPANSRGWYNDSVTFRFTCEDAISGIEKCPDPTTISEEGNGLSVTGSVYDLVGNQGTVVVPFIRIDKTVPQINYSVTGAVYGKYLINQQVNVVCQAVDSLSGLASSTCLPVSAPAYELGLGDHTFAATAVDLAGNVGQGQVTIRIEADYESLGGLTEKLVTERGIANSLQVKLRAAQMSREKENKQAAIHQLQAYTHGVEAQTGKSISAADAKLLIACAKELILK